MKRFLPSRLRILVGTWVANRRHVPPQHLFGPGFEPSLTPPAPARYASYGANSTIIPPSSVLGAERIHVGKEVVVMEGADLCTYGDGEIHFDDGAMFTRFGSITATTSVKVGRRVLTSDNVSITDSWAPGMPDRPRTVPMPPSAPVVIEDGAYLGANSIILPGVTVGAGAFVGEGAVVTEDVPPHTLVYGNPAKVVRRYDPATSEWIGDLRP